MRRGGAYQHQSYSPPGQDSPRAISAATLRLLNVPDEVLDGLTAEQVARDHNLSLRRAEYMLGVEVGRRLRGQGNG